MTKRQQRLLWVAGIFFGVSLSVTLVLLALNENLNHFYSPLEVVEGKAPTTAMIRVGGLVLPGSLQRDAANDLVVRFQVTDNVKFLEVTYTGILPDLFREGQGIVARGKLSPEGHFVAEEVLAKHDENYMPPEVTDALKAAHEAGVNPVKNPTVGSY